ncbi:hypothetical protein EGJ11_01385 [Stutzerimonas stutzeri]|nr:hypothetical protein EGJ11_01385 [Stutzerimonas stutzeri]
MHITHLGIKYSFFLFCSSLNNCCGGPDEISQGSVKPRQRMIWIDVCSVFHMVMDDLPKLFVSQPAIITAVDI